MGLEGAHYNIPMANSLSHLLDIATLSADTDLLLLSVINTSLSKNNMPLGPSIHISDTLINGYEAAAAVNHLVDGLISIEDNNVALYVNELTMTVEKGNISGSSLLLNYRLRGSSPKYKSMST